MKTLEKVLAIDFKKGANHWCVECHQSKKVIESYLNHSYIIVHYDCEHTRTYILNKGVNHAI